MPVDALYPPAAAGAAGPLADSVDASHAWAPGTRVLTLYGAGEVRGFRAADGSYEVELPFGRGSLRPSAVVGPEDLAPTALKAIGVQRTLVAGSRSRPPSTGTVAGADGGAAGGGNVAGQGYSSVWGGVVRDAIEGLEVFPHEGSLPAPAARAVPVHAVGVRLPAPAACRL